MTNFARPIRVLGLLLIVPALLLAACTGGDADPTATPPVTATADPATSGGAPSDGPSQGSDAAGGGIEPANPDAPPEGTLNSASGEVALGLGSYCWSPPQGSGNPALCADAIGIITGADDLTVEAGATLEVTGDLTWPPMAIAYALLWDAADEPIAAGDESQSFRAWQPGGGERELAYGDHSVTLPEDLAPGRYMLAINYSAGPDRGSEATYGAILIVE